MAPKNCYVTCIYKEKKRKKRNRNLVRIFFIIRKYEFKICLMKSINEATQGHSGIELINQISSDRKYLFNNTGIIMAN